ncbi:MAG TPA: APC family permease [Candidatus Acidoferrales bacterium]|nr:APC family permease [Candidatus Acidoferrales bacterium]
MSQSGFIPRRGHRPGDVRVVIGRPPKLPRTLGAPALFAACYGNVGSSIYYALGVTAAFALGLTPLALILAGGIFVTTALNYAEGTAAIPHAGGSSSFARRAFNESIGFAVGWVQLLNYTATVSISAYTAISYLGVFGQYVPFFSELHSNDTYHALAAVALTGALILVNVIGIQESSAINLGLALLDLVTQFVLVILGIWLLLNWQVVIHNIHWGVAPTWDHFLASISIAMVSYTGIETISNMAEEARNPGRSVPRATFGVIAAVLFVSAFLPTIGMSVFPVTCPLHGCTTELATTYVNDPVAGIVSAFPVPLLAYWSAVWVGILAFTIMVIATNAGLIGISRLSYSLAANDLFPRVFSRLHPRFKTPFVSIIVFGIAAAVLILPARISLMAAVYSLAATLAFATAHLAVMRLRFVEPELYRPYQMPLNIPFGRASIPVLSVLGALAIGSVFTQLMASNIENSTLIFLGWLGLGLVSYVAYMTYRRLPLWQPLEEPPPVDREVAHAPIVHPHAERVRIGRRRIVAGLPAQAPAAEHRRRRARFLTFRLLMQRYGWVRVVVLGGAFLAFSALAVWFDLSPYDPTGPLLGWSPGVVLVAFFAGLLLLRAGREE